MNSFINMIKPKKSQKDLLSEYQKILEKINNTRDKTDTLSKLNFVLNIKDISYYNSLLTQTFDKKTASDFSSKVLQLIQMNSSRFLDDSLQILNNSNICPLCFQEIPESHKKITLETLNELFDKTIEEKKNEISRMLMDKLVLPDYSLYSGKIDNDCIKNLTNAIGKINSDIETINAALKEKIGTIYEAHEPLLLEIKTDVDTFINCLEMFNNGVSQYNSDVLNHNRNKDTASAINKELSFYDVEPLLSLYKKLKKECDDLSKENDVSNKVIEELKAKNVSLISRKNNYSIALGEINDSLAYIFGTSKRLKLQMSVDGLKYFIYSNGKKIKYKKLSTGERNIIGLVYFYECLKKNCQEGVYFKTESLFVIDDPISSFDYENKMGILSFLKRILSEISKGNPNSQVLIFTHELEVSNYLNRIFADLNIAKKSAYKELKDKKLLRMNPTKYTSYGKLLSEIYEYINDESSREKINIGNTIRRLVEAYSFFNYNQEMDKFLAKKETFDKISDQTLRKYFETRMNRLVMNEGSHSESVIRQAPDSLNFDLFGDDEILRTAKDVICLLHCLDPIHINSYLGNEPGISRNLRNWINEIKELYDN